MSDSPEGLPNIENDNNNNNNNDDDDDDDDDDTNLEKDDEIPWYRFSDHPPAQGFMYIQSARATVLISNVFLASALVYLASEQADCLEEDSEDSGEYEILQNCPNRVYGFRPASLVANVTTITGLLGAFLMPVFGSIVDHTRHRRLFGIIGTIAVMSVQAIQIFTNSNTWFIMAILQAIAAVFALVQSVTNFAYLPDISNVVGEAPMRKHMSNVLILQSTHSIGFLLLLVGLSIVFDWGDVELAQRSQAVNVVWGGIFYFLGWRKMPNADACHELLEGQSLLTQGFLQLYSTIKRVQKDQKPLFYFFLAVMLAEAGLVAIITLTIIYFSEHLGISGTESGVLVLCHLLSYLPGSALSSYVSRVSNPFVCFTGSLFYLSVAVTIGALATDWIGNFVAYIWIIALGIGVGLYLPAESIIFAALSPPGQDSELSGLFTYSFQVLTWAPPLVFSTLVELDVRRTYGMISLSGFFLAAALIALLMGKWDSARYFVNNDATTTIDVENKKDNNEANNDDDKDKVKEETTLEIEKAASQDLDNSTSSEGGVISA